MNGNVPLFNMNARMGAAEVQQISQELFGYLGARFKPGYVFTLLCVHPQYHANDVVCASSARTRDGMLPAARWMKTYVLEQQDKITAAPETAEGVRGSSALMAGAREVVVDGEKIKGKMDWIDSIDAAASGKEGPDLLAVIRGALPLINPNGSAEGLNMLRAALLAHGGLPS